MIRESKKWYALALALLSVLVLIINLCFFPTCDELYFSAWRFSSVRSFLLSRPDEAPYVIGVMHNGRVLGNLLGIAQAKLALSSFAWVRAVLFTAVLFLAVYLLCRAGGRHGGFGFAAALVTVICAPRPIYADVYAWGVAFVNYLLPLVGFLLCFCLLERERPLRAFEIAGVFLIAFLSQLFMENTTLSFCVYGFLILFSHNSPRAPRFAAAIGFWIGALFMFLNPAYGIGSELDTTLKLSLSALIGRTADLAGKLLFEFGILTVLICLMFAFRLYHAGKRGRFLSFGNLALAGLLTVACLTGRLFRPLPELVLLLLAGVTVTLWFYASFTIQDRDRKRKLLTLLTVSFASLVPLIPLDRSFSPRMLLEVYLLWSLVLLILMPDRIPKERAVRVVLLALCGLWLCVMVFVYSRNAAVNRERLSYGRQQIEQGAESVTLPLVPYPNYATNESRKKGDLGFLLFRQTPLDIQIKCVPYEQWRAEQNVASESSK